MQQDRTSPCQTMTHGGRGCALKLKGLNQSAWMYLLLTVGVGFSIVSCLISFILILFMSFLPLQFDVFHNKFKNKLSSKFYPNSTLLYSVNAKPNSAAHSVQRKAKLRIVIFLQNDNVHFPKEYSILWISFENPVKRRRP